MLTRLKSLLAIHTINHYNSNGLLYVFPTCNIVNFLINITFFNWNILIKGTI